MYNHFDNAKQWYDDFWVALWNGFWLAETIYHNETKTTLAATASTFTSNVQVAVLIGQ